MVWGGKPCNSLRPFRCLSLSLSLRALRRGAGGNNLPALGSVYHCKVRGVRGWAFCVAGWRKFFFPKPRFGACAWWYHEHDTSLLKLLTCSSAEVRLLLFYCTPVPTLPV